MTGHVRKRLHKSFLLFLGLVLLGACSSKKETEDPSPDPEPRPVVQPDPRLSTDPDPVKKVDSIPVSIPGDPIRIEDLEDGSYVLTEMSAGYEHEAPDFTVNFSVNHQLHTPGELHGDDHPLEEQDRVQYAINWGNLPDGEEFNANFPVNLPLSFSAVSSKIIPGQVLYYGLRMLSKNNYFRWRWVDDPDSGLEFLDLLQDGEFDDVKNVYTSDTITLYDDETESTAGVAKDAEGNAYLFFTTLHERDDGATRRRLFIMKYKYVGPDTMDPDQGGDPEDTEDVTDTDTPPSDPDGSNGGETPPPSPPDGDLDTKISYKLGYDVDVTQLGLEPSTETYQFLQELVEGKPISFDRVTRQFIEKHAKNYTGLSADGIEAGLDATIEKITTLDDLHQIKIEAEAALGGIEKYKKASNTLGHVVEDKSLQCYAGTSFQQTILRKRLGAAEFQARNLVVIYSKGHILYGYMKKDAEGAWHLLGIESTAKGRGKVNYGKVEDLHKVGNGAYRVLDAERWMLLQVLEGAIKDPEAAMMTALNQTSEMYDGQIPVEVLEENIAKLREQMEPGTEDTLEGMKDPLAFGQVEVPDEVDRKEMDEVSPDFHGGGLIDTTSDEGILISTSSEGRPVVNRFEGWQVGEEGLEESGEAEVDSLENTEAYELQFSARSPNPDAVAWPAAKTLWEASDFAGDFRKEAAGCWSFKAGRLGSDEKRNPLYVNHFEIRWDDAQPVLIVDLYEGSEFPLEINGKNAETEIHGLKVALRLGPIWLVSRDEYGNFTSFVRDDC